MEAKHRRSCAGGDRPTGHLTGQCARQPRRCRCDGLLTPAGTSWSHGSAPVASRNGRLAGAVLEGGATEVPPPNLVLLPRRSGHRHLLAMPRALAQAMGMVGQPRGSIAARQPADLQTDRAGVLQGPWRRAAPAGGPSGRPPAPCTPSDAAFGARTLKLLNRLPSRIDHWQPWGGLPLSSEQERHTRRRADPGCSVCATACKSSRAHEQGRVPRSGGIRASVVQPNPSICGIGHYGNPGMALGSLRGGRSDAYVASGGQRTERAGAGRLDGTSASSLGGF
jgi:hypothetical protein